MQIKIFTVPVLFSEAITEDLNRFLRSHKILDIKQELILQGQNSFWSFCINYTEGVSAEYTVREKVDYKETLKPETFGIFSMLREIRKQLAADEGVPPYAVFTDKELSQISELNPLEQSKLQTIKGIGEKKVERFGEKLIQIYQERLKNEASEPFN